MVLWPVAVFLLPLLVEFAQSGGTLEIQLVKYKHSASKDYKGYCCDSYLTFWCSDCHNYLDICYRGYNPSNDNTCTSTRRTGQFDDDHTFSTGSGALGNSLNNPFSFAFNGAWKNSFSLKITIWDSDSGADDLVDYLRAGISNAGISKAWTDLLMKGKNGKTLSLKWRVQCDLNYYGDCSVLCVPQDSDLNGHYTCDKTTGQRICMSGWTGAPFCKTPICKSGCDAVHGYCDKPGECKCFSGWTGDTCSKCLTRSGCANGYCINGNDCICQSHWMGPLCDQDGSGCTGNPCLNGGTCTVTPNSFSCTCLPDYTGSNCAIDINQCRSSPCLNNATCRNLPNNFACDCSPGFSGKNCSTEINECSSDPCLYGDCSDHLNGFSCTCHSGITGHLCTSDINECLFDLDNCGPNMICENTFGGHTCKCKPGFQDSDSGNSCELIQCNHLDFLPNSTIVTFSHENRGVGSVALVICQQGYVMEGNSPLRLRCLDDGVWDRDLVPCIDVDECTQSSELCRSDEVCRNTEGSFECVRAEGSETPTTEKPLSLCSGVDTVDCIRDSKSEEVSNGKKSNLALYIGISVGGFIILLIILIVIVVVCRRRNKEEPAQLDAIQPPTQINNDTGARSAVASGYCTAADVDVVAAKLKNIEEPVYDTIADTRAADARGPINDYEDMSGLRLRSENGNPALSTIRFVNSLEPGGEAISLSNPAYGIHGKGSTIANPTARVASEYDHIQGGGEAGESAYAEPTANAGSDGDKKGAAYNKIQF